MLKRFTMILMVLGLIVGSTSLATAALIPITLVDGDWQNAVSSDGGPITISNSGLTGGLSTARWGTPAGTPSGQSGYDFLSRTTPFDANSNGVAFSLGDFTHQNYPITGTTLVSIQLLFNLGIDGLAALPATFYFTHEETPNTPPCAYGGLCNDRVTLVDPVLNDNFSYNGHSYYFSLLGFSQDGGVTIDTHYITEEGKLNTSSLYGTITETPIATPEPLTLVLLGSALLGLVGLRRKF
jgi:hypothetical protein